MVPRTTVAANVPVQTCARAVMMGFIPMDHIAEVNAFFYINRNRQTKFSTTTMSR